MVEIKDLAELQVLRHRAEVTTLIRWRMERGVEWLRAWLADPKVAGRAKALREDIASQWELGNRGQGWIE